jgi:hypothetical protein
MPNGLRRIFKQTLDRRRPKGYRWSGLLGDFGGNVTADRPGEVWVRLRQAGSNGYSVGSFPNRANVRAWYNLPVYVEMDPLTGEQYVSGTDKLAQAYGESAGNTDTGGAEDLPLHGAYHGWGGDDQVSWIHTLQVFPLRVQPSTTVATVIVEPGVYYANGVTCVLQAALTVDLSAYQPVGGAKYLVLYIDDAGAVGVVETTSLSGNALPPKGTYALGIVRLRANGVVAWRDMSADLRFVPQDTGSQFTRLLDAPDTYTGYGGHTVRVNTSEDAIEFVDAINGTEHYLAAFDATGTKIVDSAIVDGVSGDVLTIVATLTAARTLTLPDANVSITGGGTLAMGGYTLTVPAAGTVALLATTNVFTAAQTINVNSATAFVVEQPGVHDDVLVVDTANGRVGVNGPPTASAFEVVGDVRISGTEVTVAGKNKHEIYVSDGTEPLFRIQTYRWDGAAWVADVGYGFGSGALQNNTGALVSGFGSGALQNNTGTHVSGFGHAALRNNTGAYVSGFGLYALYSNTGAYVSGFGLYALYSNTGAHVSGFGHAALQNNTGAYVSGFGDGALYSNTGAYANGFGDGALRNNTGAYANGFGSAALQNNTGALVSGFGSAALQNNTGANANGFGLYALRYNQSADVIAIGDNAWASFLTNTAGAKTFDYTAINAATDRITVTAHGFGAIGTYINVLYTQGTSAITGLTTATVYQVKIIDANTIGFYEADGPGGANRGTNITAAGTGTGHTLTPQYTYTSSIVIGHDTNPTKSYQVTLGSSDIVETLLRGVVLVNTTATGGQLAVDQASTTGALPVLLLDQGDSSEEAIKVSYDAADVDMKIIKLNVTGTPIFGWDESEDKFTLNKSLDVTGMVRGTDGLITTQSVANYSDPPTDAELDAAFGTPATLGRGFIALLDDNDADTDGYIVWTTDASWYYIKATKAA